MITGWGITSTTIWYEQLRKSRLEPNEGQGEPFHHTHLHRQIPDAVLRSKHGTWLLFPQPNVTPPTSSLNSLSVQRLRTLQEKKEAQAKSARRDIATLLERGKLETARVKVENS